MWQALFYCDFLAETVKLIAFKIVAFFLILINDYNAIEKISRNHTLKQFFKKVKLINVNFWSTASQSIIY